MDDTKAALVHSFEVQRGHVLGIVDGLDADAMRRPVLPSGWTCVGLVNHLAIDVERFWFRMVLSGELPFDASDGWAVGNDVDPSAVLDLYRSEIEAADRIIASMSLDAEPLAWPEGLFGSWRLADLQQMLLHVITETACHAGHLDAARELIDGTTWMVLG
jgi:uncharacterized damage-inducible protein DinB